jgi:D-lyxose ketol-isomerase
MAKQRLISRRSVIASAGLGLAASACVGAGGASSKTGGPAKRPRFRNADCYADVKFNLEAARDAILALMAYHKYPVFPGAREQLWISDYGLGQYAEVGLAAILFFNKDAEHPGDRFMMLDIYLLPNQMLPEHFHLETPKARPKMEAWIVRNGSALIVGEGEETPGLKAKIPASQRDQVTTLHAVDAKAGDKAELNRPTARHCQLAGPDGAIVTEVANFPDNDGVRHTNPKIVFP